MTHSCRFCGKAAEEIFCDLGVQPLANSYVDADKEDAMEAFFPLCVRVCPECFLVQLPEMASAENIFGDYAYLSSTSTSWLEHARKFVLDAIPRFGILSTDLVVEIASNDGYLLKNFVEAKIPVLGIEPARNVAEIAKKAGVNTIARFMGVELARELVAEGKRAKLLVGNNVLAHVPDINDFVAGLSLLLADDGVLSMEFPHLMRLIELNQFDTIYHEHFSYLSLQTVQRIFAHHGLRVFNVLEQPTHGGSLRVQACKADSKRAVEPAVAELLKREEAFGLLRMETYTRFAAQVQEVKFALLTFLIEQKRAGKKVVGYGAPAKGNTLLNFCGVRTDLVEYTVDRNPLKAGKLLPGTRIPIRETSEILRTKPDFVLILPWNIQTEVMEFMADVRGWGGKFVVPIPRVAVL